MLSCQIPIAALEGALVTTIEGLSADRSHPVQQAWAAESVSQCGYCQPGMIMAAAALVDRAGASPGDAEIDAAIGVICRCGTYPRVREAIRRAVRIRNGQEQAGGAPPPGQQQGGAPPGAAPPSIAPEEATRQAPSLRPQPRRPRAPPAPR
jgi:isoquinoline 1-oxidoreductase alpha subunit